MRLEIIKGDITGLKVDAIVNAANSGLLGGGGVDGAIHRKAGPGLLAECREIRRSTFPEGLPTGKAVITSGYDLPAGHVIHTVGPVYSRTKDRSSLLRSCFIESLRIAEENHLTCIAFPAVSCGVYGYPREEAAGIAKDAIGGFRYGSIDRVILCLFDEETYRIFNKA